MSVYNEDIIWDEVSDQVKEAFDGTPEKILVKTAAIICRFNQYDAISKDEKESSKLSPWWFVYQSGGTHLNYSDLITSATHLREGFESHSREKLALPEPWNNMKYLFSYHTIEDVYCFKGKVAKQKVEGCEELLGGWEQLYIPNFTLRQLNKSSKKCTKLK